jgi:L-lysine 6-oxidase
MALTFRIHPSVGVARVGDSEQEFYLAPDEAGGLPIECDRYGNASLVKGLPKRVRSFKTKVGQIRRQAARFRILGSDPARPNRPSREITLADSAVESIEWTVHLANKKAAWYKFSELDGDLTLGNKNSYAKRHVPRWNSDVKGKDRQRLIVDPGPRTLQGPRKRTSFTQATAPGGYPASFPDKPKLGGQVVTLGDMLTDDDGRLLVLGGHGVAGGDKAIEDFGGQDSWHDDVSDGPVTCRVKFKNGEKVELNAWVITGSPNYAPEILNLITLDDTMFDVAVRHLELAPQMYRGHRWNRRYKAHFETEIQPILERPGRYIWVAAAPFLAGFSAPRFDPSDASVANMKNRKAYLSHFRKPGQNNILFDRGIPLMPHNAGDNNLNNNNISKFLSLTETQYFLLSQWAEGRFTVGKAAPSWGLHPLDRSSVGNCVGGPFSPGIEVTWSVRNRKLYSEPYRIKHRANARALYAKNGLDPSRDECEGGGCEPGDLTKRMAVPWQADFFDCSDEPIPFLDPNSNDTNPIPPPPVYDAYWWPPQSPQMVVSGALTADDQAQDFKLGQKFNASYLAGSQLPYARGVTTFMQMISAWRYLGFVVNQNRAPDRDSYPYFVETERNYKLFL